MSYSTFNFVKQQLFTPYRLPDEKFTGQTIVITGSNGGLGFEAAKHIARTECARLILAVRSLAKGETAAKTIREMIPASSKIVIEVWPLDMANYQSIKDFAKQLSTLDRLDVLLENAGIAPQRWAEAEGEEATIVTNVLGTFLLALLALPKLRDTGKSLGKNSRLVIVSSEVHSFTTLPERKAEEGIFNRLADKTKFNALDRYNVSKLLEVFIVRSLAANTPVTASSPVIINTLHPGLCHSNLVSDAIFPMNIIVNILKFFLAKSTEEGSITLVAGAAGGLETHGEYMSECKTKPPAPFVLSKEGQATQEQVWKELLERLEKIEPGVTENITAQS